MKYDEDQFRLGAMRVVDAMMSGMAMIPELPFPAINPATEMLVGIASNRLIALLYLSTQQGLPEQTASLEAYFMELLRLDFPQVPAEAQLCLRQGYRVVVRLKQEAKPEKEPVSPLSVVDLALGGVLLAAGGIREKIRKWGW